MPVGFYCRVELGTDLYNIVEPGHRCEFKFVQLFGFKCLPFLPSLLHVYRRRCFASIPIRMLADFDILQHFRSVGQQDLRARFNGDGFEGLDRLLLEEASIVLGSPFALFDNKQQPLLLCDPMPTGVFGREIVMLIDENSLLMGDDGMIEQRFLGREGRFCIFGNPDPESCFLIV